MNLQEKISCRVPFGTVSIQPESIHLINTFLANRMVTNGNCVREFEQAFAKLFGVEHAIAVSSGTDANTIALAVLYDLFARRGDEIIVPALSFVATGNAVINAGFTPVFVDVDRNTMNIDIQQIEAKLTSKTRAIMPVHLMGKPVNMDAIMQIAQDNGLYVIEDAAEAHGAKYRDQYTGTFGEMGCFSLYAAHIITSIEGGMIVTDNIVLADAVKSLRNHGLQLRGSDWTFERIGFSAKMNELEAAVGLGNTYKFDEIIAVRRRNLLYLIKEFQQFERYFQTIEESENEVIGPHAFPIVVKDGVPFTKKEFVQWLSEKGIDNRNLFYSIPTQCEAYASLGYKLGTFPNAEWLSNHGTHIGCHQDLSIDQLDYVVNSVKEFIKRYE